MVAIKPEANHEVEKIRIIDLVTEEMKNDKNSFELSKNGEYLVKD